MYKINNNEHKFTLTGYGSTISDIVKCFSNWI